MRIAEIVNSLEIGGAERMVVDLALCLRRRGHSVNVICLRGSGPLAEPLRQSGLEVLALQKSDGFSLRVLARLARYLGRNRFEVVHTHNPLVHHYGVLGARLAGVPVVVNTVHGLSNLTSLGNTEIIFHLGCRMTDRVVAVCKAGQELFESRKLISTGKLTTIYNGIPLHRFVNLTPGRNGKKFVFGTVGRLVPVKDHQCLLRAFSGVIRQYPQCRLEILGDGPLRNSLIDLARRLGLERVVRFHGFTLDVRAHLEGLDAFVLSSVSEALPLTLLEAMGAALPIVATSVGGVSELVEGAHCGWLCPPGQPEALAEVMGRAVQSSELRGIGMRGRQAVSKYSLERMAEEYELLFQTIYETHRNGKLQRGCHQASPSSVQIWPDKKHNIR